MRKLIQNRLHKPKEKPNQVGNCFPTVIACLLDYDSPEDVIQIQEYYGNVGWSDILAEWLFSKGYIWQTIEGHLEDDSYYLVIGETIRGNIHVCIYKNAELYHDPHPDNTGLTKILCFETITKLWK